MTFWNSEFWSESFWNAEFWGEDEAPQLLASLGGFAPQVKQLPVKEEDEPEVVAEAIPDVDVTRISNEFLSAELAADLINRARKRKARAEEEALLLIL